jgi:dienelactone hydrolase
MIRTEEIAVGKVDGHLSHAEKPRGGVLILPTITAVDAHMKDRAVKLAEAGFTSMIWNP